MGSMNQQLPSTGQFNPYANDPNPMSGSGSTFYTQAYSGGLLQPPNYHMYQPSDGYRGDLQPWQRATYDHFMPKDIREDLQKKLFAAQQVMPGKDLLIFSGVVGLILCRKRTARA